VTEKYEPKDLPVSRLDSAATHVGGAGRPFRLKAFPQKGGFELRPSHAGSYGAPYARVKYPHIAEWLARASNACVSLQDPEQFILDAIDVVMGVATPEQHAQLKLQICRDCRAPISPTDKSLIGAVPGWCHTCRFWAETLQGRSARTVIVKGSHYEIGNPQYQERPRESQWLGFGGSRWEIAFKDGRREVTHNLWSQGAIPARLRALPEWADNAEFIPEAGL
jgi:hypothetical protein